MTFFEFVLLYLLGQADTIHSVIGGTIAIVLTGTAVYGFVSLMTYGLEVANIFRFSWIRNAIIGVCVLGFLHAFVPKTKTVAIILGGSTVLEAARNDQVQSIAKNGLAIIDNELKKYLDNQTPKNEKKDN